MASLYTKLHFVISLMLVAQVHAQCQGDCSNGIGIRTFQDGVNLEGKWANGKPTGFFKAKYPRDGKEEFYDIVEWMPLTGSKTVVVGGAYMTAYFVNGEVVGDTIIVTEEMRFVGQVSENTSRPHGRGTMEVRDRVVNGKKEPGFKYIGEFAYDSRHGQGEMSWGGGAQYVGQFVGNIPHGQGTFKDVWGYVQSGSWRFGVMTGEGTATYPSGERFTGKWKQNKLHGNVTVDFGNGTKFIGTYLDGRRGSGQMVHVNGNVMHDQVEIDKAFERISLPPASREPLSISQWRYPPDHESDRQEVARRWLEAESTRGGLKDRPALGCTGNCSDGVGVMVYAAGTVLSGRFAGGKLNGPGKYKRGPVIWEGGFRDSMADGEGTWTFTDGSVRSGRMSKGAFVGVWTTTFAWTGSKITSPVTEQGIHDGRGTSTDPFGQFYEGEFRGGKYHGAGILRIDENRMIEGTFVEGVAVRGKFITPEGIYEGEMSGRGRHGYGVMRYSDGKRFVGKFVNGERDLADGKLYLSNGSLVATYSVEPLIDFAIGYIGSGVSQAMDLYTGTVRPSDR